MNLFALSFELLFLEWSAKKGLLPITLVKVDSGHHFTGFLYYYLWAANNISTQTLSFEKLV